MITAFNFYCPLGDLAAVQVKRDGVTLFYAEGPWQDWREIGLRLRDGQMPPTQDDDCG